MKKVAVLVGGGGILGREIVKSLSREGYVIAVVDRLGELAKSAADLADPAGSAKAYECDTTDLSCVQDLKSKIETELGPAQALLCNAATKSENFFEPFESFPLTDWNYVLGVNLTGPMICAQVFAPDMAKRKGCSIVNTLSIYGVVAPDQRIYQGALYEGKEINTPAIYSASKAGLWGLTTYLASYYGAQGLRVNAITPGGVFSGQNQAFVDHYSSRTMLGRMARADEIADAIAFLVSDKASYITGQNLIVDGGLTAW